VCFELEVTTKSEFSSKFPSRLRLGGSSRPADATELIIGHASHVERFQDSRHCTAMIPGSLIQRSRSRLPSDKESAECYSSTAVEVEDLPGAEVLPLFTQRSALLKVRPLLFVSPQSDPRSFMITTKPGVPDFGTEIPANRDRGKIKSRIFPRSRPNRKQD
jgi:hypothetical protein